MKQKSDGVGHSRRRGARHLALEPGPQTTRIRGAASLGTKTPRAALRYPGSPLPAESYFETISALVHFPGVSLLQ